MEQLSNWVTRRPGRVLLGVALSLLLALPLLVDLRTGALKLRIDPSFNSLLPSDDPERELYDRVRRLFGSDETLLIAVADDDVFTRDNLEAILRMTDRLERIDGVHHVVSLATALHIDGSGGDLLIEPLLAEMPEDDAGLARMREAALRNPIYAGSLVARDGAATALLVYLDEMSELEYVASGIGEQAARIVEEERGGAQAWVTGAPHVKAAITEILQRDLMMMLPVAFALVVAIAFASFRRFRGVWVPAATMAIALVWTLAGMSALGITLNLVTTVVPILIVTVGFAYSIHLMSEYYVQARSERDDGREVVRDTLSHVAVPVALTGITTAVGFLSLALSPLDAVQEFGTLAVIGVLATVAATLFFAPAVLALRPAPRAMAARGGRIERAAAQLAEFDLRNRYAILGGGALVALASLVGLTQIRVGTEVVTNFDRGHPVRESFEEINERLGGANAFYVVLEADYRDAFKEPELLGEIRRLQAWLDAQPEIGGTTSLADYLMLLNQGFHANDPAFFAIPETRALATQLLFFGAGEELEGFVDSRYETTSILVRSKVIDSDAMSHLVGRIDDHLAGLPKVVEARVTGNAVLLARTIDEISRGQVLSLSIAFLGIYVILALLFTSFRVGLIALVPNALPVLAYFGLLGLTGVTLNATTGLVACVVLGIAVDDTIHYLARFNFEAKRAADERRGVIEALRRVARPVTTTSIALCLGFLVLTLSTLRNQVEFGLLAAVTLAFAWLVDVVLTPALTSGMRIVSLWDTLTLDLGQDPHLSIPLFHGLSKRQSRIAALMMRVEEYPEGHSLCRVGQQGDAMWVVIEGALSASIAPDGEVVPLRTMERGDVVGEVALFQGHRTADVDALSDVRLLAVTREDLERLPGRYPRIAARVFRNLSDILADRLAKSTVRIRST